MFFFVNLLPLILLTLMVTNTLFFSLSFFIKLSVKVFFIAFFLLLSCKIDPWCKIVFVQFCPFVQLCLQAILTRSRFNILCNKTYIVINCPNFQKLNSHRFLVFSVRKNVQKYYLTFRKNKLMIKSRKFT